MSQGGFLTNLHIEYLQNWWKIIAERKTQRKFILTSTSWPIQAKETVLRTAQTTANAMQNGETAKVRCETAPKNGTLMKDSAVRLNHLKN